MHRVLLYIIDPMFTRNNGYEKKNQRGLEVLNAPFLSL
jgi:hypothetical protein